MTAARIEIRRAGPADTSAARALFALRSQSDEATANDPTGPDLDDPRRRMWLAFDGDRAVGMNSVQDRELRIQDQACRIAYWMGLFVDPDYRNHFIYPQLVLAMFTGLRAAGMPRVYAAIRRQQVADAHLKVGFRKIGDLAVLAKPLRPALLFAKYKRLIGAEGGHRLLRALCALPDAIFAGLVRLQGLASGEPATEMSWLPAPLAEVAGLYARSNSNYVAQAWTVEALRARYGGEGSGYRLLGVRDRGRLLAAAIVRLVDRPEGIRAAVIMDLLHEPEAWQAAGTALAAVERLALASRCEVVLFLDGVPADQSRFIRRRGYFRSPEKYSLILWTDGQADLATLAHDLPQDLHAWRFTFADHDTF